MSPTSINQRTSSLESLILPKLRPFQREAFEFAVNGKLYDRQLIENDHGRGRGKGKVTMDPSLLGKGRILLADEMGLG